MNVLIVLPVDYPTGGAAANRIEKFARGLASCGAKPYVLAAKLVSNTATPTDSSERWETDRHGIKFLNIAWSRPLRILPFYLARAIRLRRSFRQYARETIARERIDAVILYGHSGIISGPIASHCRQLNIPCIMDITEYHPVTFKRVLMLQSLDQWLCLHRLLPRLDGVIAISSWLEAFATSKRTPTLKVPVLGDADDDRFPTSDSRPDVRPHRFRMLYLGQLAERDLPETMLAGLKQAIENRIDAELVIVGSVHSRSNGRNVRALIDKDPILKERVILTGWVSDEELRQYLQSSDCFVLLREDEIQTRACLPTRLPDYLLAGKPVILSDVGDLSVYFRHRENAWAIPPGEQPERVANALAELSESADESRRIGQSGKDTCRLQFCHKKHGRAIMQFLEQLSTSKN
ncbi:glycosyltransferase family 4 protein [Roseiconus lacunae]|uniref:glycosyltransferase family 4 protein n=1 Tax=Roseiconus lacunae TaxID=2605694 RepID=UPI001E34A533|nr:glycosyltransferase family 4 protein [Roseiconus lacunae]MCD0459861.1 glycosyltransferase family 4 protein [Roseiconus lacunae]